MGKLYESYVSVKERELAKGCDTEPRKSDWSSKQALD